MDAQYDSHPVDSQQHMDPRKQRLGRGLFLGFRLWHPSRDGGWFLGEQTQGGLKKSPCWMFIVSLIILTFNYF